MPPICKIHKIAFPSSTTDRSCDSRSDNSCAVQGSSLNSIWNVFFWSYFDVFGPTFVRFFIRKSGKWYHKKKEKPRENTQSKLETQEEMSDVLGELVAR